MWVAELFLLIGAAILAGLAVLFATAVPTELALRREGVLVVGRVRKVRLDTTSEGYDRRRVTIEYGLPDGRTAELVRSDERPGGGRLQVGDPVTLLFHPARPGRAVAVHAEARTPPPPGPLGLVVLSAVCGLGAFVLLALMF